MYLLLRAFLMIIACTGYLYAAPGAPSNMIITHDETPTFPSVPRNIIVNKPVVTLTIPNKVGSGPYYENGTIEWTATCTNANDTIASVQLYSNGAAVGTADTTSPYSGAWVYGLSSDATRTLTAHCVADDGNSADSTGQEIIIDVKPPSVSSLMVLAISHDELIAKWVSSDDNSGVATENIQRCNPSPCTPTNYVEPNQNPYVLTGTTVTTIYDWTVQATDAVGNVSAQSNKVTASVSDLVGHYRFDNSCNDDAYTDNDCTLVGDAGFFHTGDHYVLDLDGTGDYATAPDHANYAFTTEITVTAWVNCNDTCGNSQYIAAQASLANRVYALRFGDIERSVLFQIYSDNTSHAAGAILDNQVPDNGWFFVSGVYDGAKVQLYRNAAKIHEVAFVGTIDTDAVALTMGATGDGLNNVNGLIGPVRIYRRALSFPAINHIYELGAP